MNRSVLVLYLFNSTLSASIIQRDEEPCAEPTEKTAPACATLSHIGGLHPGQVRLPHQFRGTEAPKSQMNVNTVRRSVDGKCSRSRRDSVLG